MKLEQKQIAEKNHMFFLVGIIVLVSLFVFALLGFVDADANMGAVVFRTVFIAIGLVTVFISYAKEKGTTKFVHFCSVALVVAYGATILTNKNVAIYSFVFIIMLPMMIYMDTKLLQKIGVAVIILNVVATINVFMRYPDMQMQAFIFLLLSVVYCVVVGMVVKMQARHSDETSTAIREQMDVAAQVSAEIIGLSEQLAEKFDVAREKAEILTESMETTNTSVNEIASSVKLTAEAIEEQTLQTYDIQRNLEDADTETKGIEQASIVSQEALKEGAAVIEELKLQAISTGEINRETKASTEELNSRIKDVEAIVSTILSISDQTNLLALNASIEAARAGEAGKGFSVVADEIRKLSEETKESTSQITDIINKLTDNVGSTSEKMQLSAESSDRQNEMIETTKEKFELIEEKMGVLHTSLGRLTGQVDHILDANTKINDNITNLSAVSEEVASSSESSISISEDSLSRLGELNEILSEIYEVSQKMKNLAENKE